MYKLSISGACSDDEHAADLIRLAVSDRNRRLHRFAHLPVEVARGCSDVAHLVDTLDDRQAPASIVAKEDIDRMPGHRRTNRQFERGACADATCNPKDEILHREVTFVGRCFEVIALHVDSEAKVKRHRESLPGIERVTTASTQLEIAHSRLRQANLRSELALRLLSPTTRRADCPTERSELLPVAALRLCRQLRWLELDHSGCMVLDRPSRPISSR